MEGEEWGKVFEQSRGGKPVLLNESTISSGAWANPARGGARKRTAERLRSRIDKRATASALASLLSEDTPTQPTAQLAAHPASSNRRQKSRAANAPDSPWRPCSTSIAIRQHSSVAPWLYPTATAGGPDPFIHVPRTTLRICSFASLKPTLFTSLELGEAADLVALRDLIPHSPCQRLARPLAFFSKFQKMPGLPCTFLLVLGPSRCPASARWRLSNPR
jgi:hypothetical protein